MTTSWTWMHNLKLWFTPTNLPPGEPQSSAGSSSG